MPKKKNKDDLCRQCGKCCYIKTVIGNIAVFTRKHCEYLDKKTNLCTIYKDRFKIKPDCLNIEKAIQIRAVPNDCPYVQNLNGYDGPKWVE